MKLTIESTDKLTHIDGVAVRVWNGVTEKGTKCLVFVHRVAVAETEDATDFERELSEQLEPGRTVALRNVL